MPVIAFSMWHIRPLLTKFLLWIEC